MREAADESENPHDYMELENAQAIFADMEFRRFRLLADAARHAPQSVSASPPVTIRMLRDNWYQEILNEDEVAVLEQLPDSHVQQALDAAVTNHEDAYLSVLDNVRDDATAALLNDIRAAQ